MLEPLKVLLVGDNASGELPSVAGESMRRAGYATAVEVVGTSVQAAYVLSRAQIDVVFVMVTGEDVSPLDIIATTERLRPQAPVLVLEADAGAIPAILRSGGADFVSESEWANLGLIVARSLNARTDLQRSESPSVIDLLPVPACTISHDGAILDANRDFAECTGHDAIADVLGKSLPQVGIPAEEELLAPPSPRVKLQGGGEAMLRISSEAGSGVKTVILWPIGEESVLMDAREHEQQAADSRNLRLVAEAAADFTLYVRDSDAGLAVIEWASDSLGELVGGIDAGRTELAAVVGNCVHPDDRVPLLRAMVAVQVGERKVLRARLRGPDGVFRSFDLVIVPALDDRNGLTVVVSGREVDPDNDALEQLARTRRELSDLRTELEADRALAAESAEQYRSYVASLTHEIRTPLTGIIGFSEVLEEEVQDQHREMASRLAQSGRLLLDVLQSVLLMARLEDDDRQMAKEEVDLAEQARRAVDALLPLAENRGLSLTLDGPDRLPARVDRGAVARILMNVIGNGIKFTDQGGVAVRLVERDSDAVIEISDTGVGIEPEFIPKLFSAFSREDREATHDRPGSGLGLMITHRLCTLIGADIEIQSERDAGTRVRVTIPRGDVTTFGGTIVDKSEDFGSDMLHESTEIPDLPALFDANLEDIVEGPASADGDEETCGYRVHSVLGGDLGDDGLEPVSFDEIDWDDPRLTEWIDEDGPDSSVELGSSGDGAHEPAEIAGDGAVGPAPRSDLPRLLVVEDNEETRMLLDRVLKPHYIVDSVADARSALDAMARVTYDVLLFDIHLGGKQTGADVLRIARTLPGYSAVPAIAVTAYALPGDEAQYLAAGFDGYVSKPFTVDVLLRALKRAGAPRRVRD